MGRRLSLLSCRRKKHDKQKPDERSILPNSRLAGSYLPCLPDLCHVLSRAIELSFPMNLISASQCSEPSKTAPATIAASPTNPATPTGANLPLSFSRRYVTIKATIAPNFFFLETSPVHLNVPGPFPTNAGLSSEQSRFPFLASPPPNSFNDHGPLNRYFAIPDAGSHSESGDGEHKSRGPES